MKNLIKISFVFFISLSLSIAHGQSTRAVDFFQEISASTNVTVKLIKADVQKVVFKMLSGEADALVTKTSNKKLVIKIKSGMFNGNSKTKAAVTVYYTELNGIEGSAGATIKSEELIYASEMDIDVSSGAIADLEIEAGEIDAEASSGARIILEGSATSASFDVSSGANLEASKMVCDNVSADVSSGGELEIHVNKKLNAEASSGGSIRYRGNVEYTNTDSGWSGQIKRIK